MSPRKIAAIGAVVVALAAAAGAQASSVVPRVFGQHTPPGWVPPTLSPSCQREPINLPFGNTWAKSHDGVIEAFTVVSAQLKCDQKRISKMAKCARQPTPTVTIHHGDDWTAANLTDAAKGIDHAGPDGVDALQASIVSLKACLLDAAGLGS